MRWQRHPEYKIIFRMFENALFIPPPEWVGFVVIEFSLDGAQLQNEWLP